MFPILFSGSIDNGVTLILCLSGIIGFLQESFGPLKLLKLACLFNAASFGTLIVSFWYKSDSINIIYVSRFLAGISRSCITTNVYIAEVLPTEIRGMFVLMESSFRAAGNLLVYSLGYFIDFSWYGPLFGWIPILSLIWLQLQNPESPVHLIKTNQDEKANKVTI